MSKGAQTRERIVDRAWRLASRDGLGGLSLGKLASDVGLSKSGLFAHFGSKEELELALLHAAEARFESDVLRPALSAPRGVPRLRALFGNWQRWIRDPSRLGGCIFLAASAELDDAEGPLRDVLVQAQTAWLSALAKAARIAIDAGHFRADLDCGQFAFEMLGIALAYHHAKRLLRDPKADARSGAAFECLLAAAAPR